MEQIIQIVSIGNRNKGGYCLTDQGNVWQFRVQRGQYSWQQVGLPTGLTTGSLSWSTPPPAAQNQPQREVSRSQGPGRFANSPPQTPAGREETNERLVHSAEDPSLEFQK